MEVQIDFMDWMMVQKWHARRVADEILSEDMGYQVPADSRLRFKIADRILYESLRVLKQDKPDPAFTPPIRSYADDHRL